MKCPKCNKEGFRYIEKRTKSSKKEFDSRWSIRKSIKKECKNCDYKEG